MLMNCRIPRPDASCTLFCFPWAGSGSNFYAEWGRNISDNLEVVGITLPGREGRSGEPFVSSVQTIVDEISSNIHENYSKKPYAFWGHSLGALLSFQTALVMKEKYGSEPVQMYLSGISAPHASQSKQVKTRVADMTDEEFIQFLRNLGGTPPELLRDRDMMNVYLPVLRADYNLLDQFDYTLPEGDPPFSCPYSFFDGKDDVQHDIYSWRQVTSGPFSVKKLPGGHFYLKDEKNKEALLDIINKDFSGMNEML